MQADIVFLLHLIGQRYCSYVGLEAHSLPSQLIRFKGIEASAIRNHIEKLLTRCPNQIRGFEKLASILADSKESIVELAIEECRLISQATCQILLITDIRYPANLRYITDPPLALKVAGDPSIFDRPMVAIIGSRNASNSALYHTFELAKDLAARGYVIVSGGAFGCDTMAHEGALAGAEQSTVVVQAGGLAKLYPATNRSLFTRILARGGAIISERLWQQPCRPYDFPVRNRIISGLVEQVVVTEARLQSGAISTANLAARQGRDVFVLDLGPHCAAGSQLLMEDGAYSAKSYEEMSILLRSESRRLSAKETKA